MQSYQLQFLHDLTKLDCDQIKALVPFYENAEDQPDEADDDPAPLRKINVVKLTVRDQKLADIILDGIGQFEQQYKVLLRKSAPERDRGFGGENDIKKFIWVV